MNLKNYKFSRWMEKGNLTAPLPRPPDAIKKGKEVSPLSLNRDFLFETLCVSSHTACRFAEICIFSALFGPDGYMELLRPMQK